MDVEDMSEKVPQNLGKRRHSVARTRVTIREISQMSARKCIAAWHQCVWVLICVQLFCDPMDCSPPGSSVHGIAQARIVECCHFLLQRFFLTQGLNCISYISKQISYHSATREAPLPRGKPNNQPYAPFVNSEMHTLRNIGKFWEIKINI